MRSVLTRFVFRRIIRNEPIIHRDCLYRVLYSPRHNGRRLLANPQRRTLFGFMRQRPRDVRAADMEPGLETLMDACRNMELRTRLPEPGELAKAWSTFFHSKRKKDERVNDLQASYALRVYEYLRNLPESDFKELLSFDDLRIALRVLSSVRVDMPDRTLRKAFVPLAKEVYSELESRRSADSSLDQSDTGKVHSGEIGPAIFQYWLVRILCASGLAKEARNLVADTATPANVDVRCWSSITAALAADGDSQELGRTADLFESTSLPVSSKLATAFALAFAKAGNMENAKFWAPQSQESGLAKAEFVNELLQACLKNNDLEWGRSIVRDVTENGLLKKEKLAWDGMFIWALGSGKSVEELNRMMEVMVRTEKSFIPNHETINKLIGFANSRNDPYLAERILNLGRKWGVEPDAMTYLLQMDYRLSVGDIEGARAAYHEVQAFEVRDGQDVPRINRLIQAMCSTRKYDFNTIMAVVEDLNERRTRFPPETVAALAILHLKRDEYHDVADLLNTHVHHYSEEERATVRETFANFCLDRNNSIARVWDTYMIFQQIFNEADRETRTSIMREFLTRKRADMAVHVFNHMREHVSDEVVPTVDTYCIALAGIGKLNDGESLAVLHNALKLDMNIEPSTKLYNALMLGYSGCEKSDRALGFWDHIVHNNEGPTYNSLLIVFRVCELAPFAERKTVALWKQLHELDIEITRDLVAAYLSALGGNYLFDEAREVVKSCEDKLGFKPDAVMLGMLFNATRNYHKQQEMEKWMKEGYPDVWGELETLGAKRNFDGTRIFRVQVVLEP